MELFGRSKLEAPSVEAMPAKFVELATQLLERERRAQVVLEEYELPDHDAREQFHRYVANCRIGRLLLAHDFERMTPPEHWFVGSYRNEFINSSHWPSANRGAVLSFDGPVPKWAVARYKEARKLGVSPRQVAIYSPHKADFAVVLADPIMSIRLMVAPDEHIFFEIARWDTARDLESLISQ